MAVSGSSCGACKFLRRKCAGGGCTFAPYFSYEEAVAHFAAVHKVFGASNASRLLSHLPVHRRAEAAATVAYEALARMRDPVYGCVGQIFALQQQVANLEEEIVTLGNLMVGAASNESDPNQALQIYDDPRAQMFQHVQGQALPLPQIGNAIQTFHGVQTAPQLTQLVVEGYQNYHAPCNYRGFDLCPLEGIAHCQSVGKNFQ